VTVRKAKNVMETSLVEQPHPPVDCTDETRGGKGDAVKKRGEVWGEKEEKIEYSRSRPNRKINLASS
jgi:hypothetical protein